MRDPEGYLNLSQVYKVTAAKAVGPLTYIEMTQELVINLMRIYLIHILQVSRKSPGGNGGG